MPNCETAANATRSHIELEFDSIKIGRWVYRRQFLSFSGSVQNGRE